MPKRDLCFSAAGEQETEELLLFSSEHPFGAEIYTSLKICGAQPRIGSLWAGREDDGSLGKILYDNGAYVTDITEKRGTAARLPDGAALFETPPRKNRLRMMIYKGGECPAPSHAVQLHGTELIRIYQAVKESEALSDKTEKRYVYRVLCDNAGLSESFVIQEDGRTAATASICAKNRKYALIGDVYTVYAYRYQGYASALVRACVACAQKRGLVPVLYCEKELTGFYKRLGFDIKIL